jgi:hypothetical protein
VRRASVLYRVVGGQTPDCGPGGAAQWLTWGRPARKQTTGRIPRERSVPMPP